MACAGLKFEYPRHGFHELFLRKGQGGESRGSQDKKALFFKKQQEGQQRTVLAAKKGAVNTQTSLNLTLAVRNESTCTGASE